MPILISDKPSDDVDDQVIGEMERYGITREEILRNILAKSHSAIGTLYYLLLDVLVTKRKASGNHKKGNGTTPSSSSKATKPSSFANTANITTTAGTTNSGNTGIIATGTKQVTPTATTPTENVLSAHYQYLQQQQQHLLQQTNTNQRPKSAAATRSGGNAATSLAGMIPKPLITILGQR